MDPMICEKCRTPVMESRMRGWIHSEPIPEGVPVDHEIVPVEAVEAIANAADEAKLNAIGEARKRVSKMRETARLIPGVQFNDIAHDSMLLLEGIEELERELAMVYGERPV